MRTNLDSDPRIISMSQELSIPELHVVGLCWKVWSWADSHSIDGNAIRVTDVTLDRFTSVTGFCSALRKVGWLEGESNAITFPRFAEHNGQTAKKRGETAIRVAKHRNAKGVTNVTQKVLPEQSRVEEIRIDKSMGGAGGDFCFDSVSEKTLADTDLIFDWIKTQTAIANSEDSRLFALECAEKAIETGNDPPALFRYLISNRAKAKPTKDQRKRATKRLRDFNNTIREPPKKEYTTEPLLPALKEKMNGTL